MVKDYDSYTELCKARRLEELWGCQERRGKRRECSATTQGRQRVKSGTEGCTSEGPRKSDHSILMGNGCFMGSMGLVEPSSLVTSRENERNDEIL